MIFTVGLHPVFKTLGLKMEGRDHFDPLGPMAVAHDLMEHFDDDDGSEEHELLAIGASWFVRNHGQYLRYKGFPRFSSTVDHLIANIRNVLDTLNGRELQFMVNAPRAEVSGLVLDYLHEARKSGMVAAIPDDEWELMCKWLKWGYVRAVRRYAGLSPGKVCEVFRSIEDQAAGYLQGAQLGAKCKITIDLSVPKATLEKLSD